MRLDAHYGMLPERAFEKRGFGHTRPATLEGGGKGGGGGPSQTTAYQTNLPEYAKPYVTSMLEATQRQLFTGTPNADGGYDITGFRPYQPYSTDPTKYFAGPSSLQQQAYQEAGTMQTPGQFAPASGLAQAAGQQALGTQGLAGSLAGEALGYGQAGAGYGQAGQMFGAQGAAQAQRAAQQAQRAAGMYGGMGAGFGAQAAALSPEAQRAGLEAAGIGMQGLGYGGAGAGYGAQAANMAGMGFGAGQQFMRGVTDPSQVGAFMSPYQQQVTDIAKASAIREAQMLEQGNRLAAARQGTYGGARQALASLERERNLATNLANIQAQGSQQAYDRALAQMQFGSNLGLQGLGAGVGALQAGISGAGMGLQGLGTALQGQQARMQGLQQAGQLLGQGMQGAQTGLQGVGQQIAGGQLGLAGTAQGIQGAQAGMQGAGVGLQGVGQATQAGQLGLQGAQAATQAAGTLGNLGTAEQQADLARIGLQQQLGSAQQQYQQSIINQAIQDYATAQQYPMMQLGFMSNMLRGLPMQATTTQSYMPTPSLGTQAIAGLGTLYGVGKGTGMFKEGGEIKGYAGGDVINSTRARLEALADAPNGIQQVAQIAQSSPSAEMRKMANEVLIEKRMEEQAAAQAEQSIAQDEAPRGLAAAPAPVLDTMGAAGGGIVAFAGDDEEEGSVVNYDPNKVYADPYKVLSDAEAIARRKGQREMMGIGEVVSPEYKKYIEEQRGGLGGLKERATGWDIADIFGNMYQSALERPGQGLIGQLTSGAAKASPSIRERQKELRGIEKDIATMGQDVYGRERADQLALLTGTEKEREDVLKRIANRREREISANAGRITDLDKTTDAIFADLVSNGGMDPKNPATRATARRMAIEQTGLAYQKMDLASGEKLYKALKDDKDLKSLRRQQMQYEEGSKEYQAIEDKIAAREQTIRTDFGRSQSTSGGTPGAIPKPDTSSGRFPKPDITKVKGAPEGSVIGEQTNKGWEVMNKDGKVIGYVQR